MKLSISVVSEHGSDSRCVYFSFKVREDIYVLRGMGTRRKMVESDHGEVQWESSIASCGSVYHGG